MDIVLTGFSFLITYNWLQALNLNVTSETNKHPLHNIYRYIPLITEPDIVLEKHDNLSIFNINFNFLTIST